MGRTLYASDDRTRYFHVPDDVRLVEGPYVVRTLTGRELRVEQVAIEIFEIPEDEAKAIVRAQLDVFLGKAKNVASAALAALRSHAPDPSPAPPASPEEVKAIVRDLAAAANETINDPDVARARAEKIAGALRAEGADEDVAAAVEKIPERLREALQSEELANAVDELTAALRKATAELDAELAAVKKPAPEDN
ncbi:MAG: hypothetical protein ACOZNI_24340 [Myxococcota bacterium]